MASVTALPDHRLRVTFVDGTTGEVDMRRFSEYSSYRGHHLRATAGRGNLFSSASVLGAIQLANGADLARDAMYDTIREQGVWIVD